MTDREIFCESALTPDGWLAPAHIQIGEDGFIRNVSVLEGAAAARPLAGPVLPGMPNLHSHAFQRQMAGLTELSQGQADNFWTWREAMYRLADRVTPEQLRSIAAWLQAEMLESGFTSCAEFHYVHHQPDGQAYQNPAEMCSSLIDAADATGMALTLLPVLYCRSGFSSSSVTRRQRRFFNTPESYLGLVLAGKQLIANRPLHHIGIAPHSLRAASIEQIQQVHGATETAGLPIHIHIAEQALEVEECQALHGARPVEWLLQNFPVDSRWCLVHATHLDTKELNGAASSGAVAGLCPTTEADLGDGFFAAESWIAAGGHFGIGSDSNLRVSVAEELRMLEFGCRLRTTRRNVLADQGRSCGRSIYERAALGGAMALGQPVGRIEAGYRADLVELDSNHPLLAGRCGDEIVDTWLFASGSSMVHSVWVGGSLCVAESKHLNRDALDGPFRQTMKDLL